MQRRHARAEARARCRNDRGGLARRRPHSSSRRRRPATARRSRRCSRPRSPGSRVRARELLARGRADPFAGEREVGASAGSSAKPSACASAIAYHMPPNATSTVSVPKPSTSSGSVEPVGEARDVRELDALAASVAAGGRTSTTPAGASRRSVVSGSRISTIPVSSRTVATQIVFEPDIAGYSVGSMMMKPASQPGRDGGHDQFACTATLPRGSRSSSRRKESSARSAASARTPSLPAAGARRRRRRCRSPRRRGSRRP